MSQGTSFAAVLGAFNGRVDDLKQLTMLRDADPTATRASFQHLEAMVAAVELQLQHAQQKVQEEAAAIPQAYAIIAQMEHQHRHLEHISNHLPSRLPGAPPPGKENALHVPLDAVKTPAAAAAPPADEGAGAEEQATAGRPVTARKKKAAEPAPRHYITVTELNSVSSYMRGRITQDKVNAAVDDLANLADESARRVAALAGGRKPRGLDDEALRTLKLVVMRAEVKGQCWFLEAQLKEGVHLKPDNTGKALITVDRKALAAERGKASRRPPSKKP